MIQDLFQTSLYFFSALLQADAAILGFGTIFVIFKLQSLDSLRQSLLQAYYTKGPGHTGKVNILLLSKKPEEIANILSEPSGYDFENYCRIVCIPKIISKISSSVKLPIWIIGTHTVFCAILLFASHLIYHQENIQIVIVVICLLWFATGVFLAGHLAITTLLKKEKYDLEELFPEVAEKIKK